MIPTYCQSKDKVKNPKPSLLVAPPKMFVRVAALDPVACIAAKQGMDTELSQGNMYAGKNSYANIHENAIQNHLMGLESLTDCQCRPWITFTVGRLLQYTASTCQTQMGRMIPQIPYPNSPIEMVLKMTVTGLRGRS